MLERVIQGNDVGVRRRRLRRAGGQQHRGSVRAAVAALALCAGIGAAAPAAHAGTASRAVSATPAPIGVFPGHSARSVAGFERQLGRRVDYAHDYLDKRTWSKMLNVKWLAREWTDAGFGGRTVFTVPMLPDRGGSMRQGARGRYNKRFRLLAKRLVAGGQGSTVLRIGPEFNGTWFKWTIKGRGGATRYKRYWRHIARTMNRVKGANFRFDWSPMAGSSWVGGRRLRAAKAYPGSKYVDYIGLDIFDQSWARHRRSAARRWREFMYQTDGLAWHARFAKARRKPMTFPEWGLVKRRDDRGGGDNPYFIRKMHRWIQTHNVAYHLYFESRDPNGEYRVFSGRFPKAAKSFIRYFGAPGA